MPKAAPCPVDGSECGSRCIWRTACSEDPEAIRAALARIDTDLAEALARIGAGGRVRGDGRRPLGRDPSQLRGQDPDPHT